ncbi:EVE domain-containing protein [Candidatus Bathyarchaeota archaeon]|nr:EVE domain-containing protein [Candidatus Bathyarchaeota archaeon]
MEEKGVFLIQQSGKIAEHYTAEFQDRTYAEEAIKYGYYRNDAWDIKKRDQDFGKIKVGDYILAYYTGDVGESPSRISRIYEVTRIENIPDEEIKNAVTQDKISSNEADQLKKNPHILRLKMHRRLKRGLELSLIRQWVEESRLSINMNNCGKLGFNICEVSYEDCKTIIEWDEKEPEVVALPEPYEEMLRTYVVSKPLEETLGPQYGRFKLYEDAEGRTGELYNTPIGQIDILYRNKETGDFLVVELKRTEDTSDCAAGQIARYTGWVKENLAKERMVCGLIIAHSASEQLKYALKALKNCKFATYEVAFKFTMH